MKVRYLVSEASLLQEWQLGEIYDLPDAEAEAAIRAGKAEALVSTYPEAATRSASEAAVMQRARGRRV